MNRYLLSTLLIAAPALADEGMWTFNNFPSETVQKKYGFAPTSEWLDHVRLASARMAEGCSASFVSPNGLVMTNHHCAHSCIQQLSTAKRDYVQTGFYAKTEKDEVKCPALEINQLTDISDVTDRVLGATSGLTGKAYTDAQKKITSEIESTCANNNDRVRCEVVSLYEGGKYHLYKYRRYQDVRLVFAPEFAIAFFGGDPDNFNFPRYDLDVSFVRVYEDNHPAKTDNYFKWSAAGVKDGDLTFVSGNPGGTSRNWTVAQLEYERDVRLPDRLFLGEQMRGLLTEFQERGPEQKRYSNDTLFYVENSFKALRLRFETLTDKVFFATKVAAENELRAKVDADPAKKKEYGDAWDAIATALVQQKNVRKPVNYVGFGGGFQSRLFGIAQTLLRAGDERLKDNAVRLEEFSDARLPQLRAHLLSPAPIYKEFEIFTLTASLMKMREELGADDPLVRKFLGKKSPAELAKELVNGTRFKGGKEGVALRQKIWDGGKKAVDASDDPMILFAKLVDPDARALRKHFEDDIDSVVRKNSERIAKVRFDIYGTSTYPDATFTARLSYGTVKGFPENGQEVKPITTLAGAFDRATGRDPYKLPDSWDTAKARLDLGTPFNFCSTTDIIGGNSGSPVVNQAAEIVGLVFDGNIYSLGGDYGFDEATNRTVSVHSAALIEALDKIYGARRIVSELRPSSAAAGAHSRLP
jgi:V8-like Glu-specific endopeptidase